MVNNFHAVKQQLQEIEPTLNAVPIKTQGAKQALFMALKHLDQLEFWVDRAEKHEMTQ